MNCVLCVFMWLALTADSKTSSDCFGNLSSLKATNCRFRKRVDGDGGSEKGGTKKRTRVGKCSTAETLWS